MNGLNDRHIAPELMDAPGLDLPRHRQALDGLRRINFISRAASQLWRELGQILRSEPTRRWRLLDVATGGGENPIAFRRHARRAGIELEVAACDRSPQAVSLAQAAAGRAGESIRVFQHDVLAEGVPEGYDVIVCSLFLHHLSSEEAVQFLAACGQSGSGALLVSDLERCIAGYVLALAGTRALSRSPIVHHDGPQSVRAAFTLPEVRAIAAGAGLDGVTLRRCWPCRFLMIWRRPA